MDNEKNDYYFGAPPLFVRTLTRRDIETAVAALIQEPRFLEVYGTLQSREDAPATLKL